MGFFDTIFGASSASSASLPCLESAESLEAVLLESETTPVLLYKHSNACGTSLFSRREVEALAEDHPGAVYQIIVQNARPVSNNISSLLGIRHETPQVIVVRNRLAEYHRSHGGINRDEMSGALKAAM